MTDPTPSPDPKPLSESANRFISSMTVTYEMWHDGTGYDLETLKGLSSEEMAAVEKILIDHRPRDWRDIEALATIDSPRAKQEIESALKSADVQVRQQAQRSVDAEPPKPDRARLLIQSPERDDLLGGLGAALDEVAEFHPPEVSNSALSSNPAVERAFFPECQKLRPDPNGAKIRKVGMLLGGRATTRGAAHPTTLLNEVCGVDPAVAGQMAAFLPNRRFRHCLKPRMDRAFRGRCWRRSPKEARNNKREFAGERPAANPPQ